MKIPKDDPDYVTDVELKLSNPGRADSSTVFDQSGNEDPHAFRLTSLPSLNRSIIGILMVVLFVGVITSRNSNDRLSSLAVWHSDRTA